METRELLAGLSAARIAALSGVDLTTARRWKRTAALPEPARRLLELLTTGNMGTLSRAWRGWSVVRDQLISEDGLCFKPSEIRSIPYTVAAWRAAQRRNRLAKQADWISERYVEPDETVGGPAARKLSAVS